MHNKNWLQWECHTGNKRGEIVENMISAKEAADYLTAKFGWPVKPSEISILARSSHYNIKVDCTKHRHLYSRQDIEAVVLDGPNSVSQCRKPFWPRGGELKPSSVTYYYNNARNTS
jgi:hypothetical protein